MKIAIGSDKRIHLTDAVIAELEKRGHLLERFGSLAEGATEGDPASDWPLSGSELARAVATGRADQGVLFCWTGTGASIAANKVPGVRAALVHDAETARGARIYNHANVLVLSMRATSEAVAMEILAAWLETPLSTDEWNLRQVRRIAELEQNPDAPLR